MVEVYISKVSTSCAIGYFQMFVNNGTTDYYCRCNDSVPVITPTCSTPGFTCLGNGQYPLCFGYTQCQLKSSGYNCSCVDIIGRSRSHCHMPQDCQQSSSTFNQPSNPLGGAFSTNSVSTNGKGLTINCTTDFLLNHDSISSTMACLSTKTWTTLRATPCLLPPQISTAPNNVALVEGSSYSSFTCTSYGYPSPNIEWYHDGVQLPHTQINTTMTSSGNRTSPASYTSILPLTNVKYADRGHYTCVSSVSNTGFDGTSHMTRTVNATATLSILVPCRAQLPTHFLETSHPVTDKAGTAHCGQTAADVILVVDESRSMEPHYKNRLYQIVGNLSVSLEEHGIGLYPGKPNQYTVVGFGHLKGETGSDGHAGPHVIRSNNGRQVYDLAGFREACAKLQNTGSVEDGYLAIKYALENITSEGSSLLRLKRHDVAPIIILVSDADRDIQLQGKGITRNSIKKLIRKSGATLEAIVDNSIWYNNQRGFGMDSKGTLYIAENTTHYTTSNKQQHKRYLALHYRNTRKDYSSVALELKGAVWDLNSILDSDALFASHVNAFVESTVTHVESRVHKCCSCQCAHGPEHSSLHCTYASSVQECKRP
ncbi:uncharacterized protein LOC135810909 [Sycon ciliatum]|uniref:uncharacterized protein LOC135810909 n=1 Tax=Sycon ciliatum TaxID=27933 RepID=UPI0031F663E4